MANGHGGARPGAGRPRNSEKYAAPIAAFHDAAAAELPDRYAAIRQLADGGVETIQETWEPAGLIYVSKQVETGDGTIRVSELAFPELPPERLVCVRRTRSIAAPDLRANMYLVDRVAGKPIQKAEITGEDGGPVVLALSDDERAARAAELFERARARRAGLAADGEPGELP